MADTRDCWDPADQWHWQITVINDLHTHLVFGQWLTAALEIMKALRPDVEA
jgi:hypothetical protein